MTDSLAISSNLISPFIANQFPEFYEIEGQMFIKFVQAYYQWLEQPGNTVNLTKNILSNIDVDSAPIPNFDNIYLTGIPYATATDQRLLLKHILDLYKAKGTAKSYELLFRAFYAKDVNIYTPSKDIFKVSAGTWYQPYYLEVSNLPFNSPIDLTDFIGQQITGSVSGATAFVKNYAVNFLQNKVINVLELTNLSGNFVTNETISYTDSFINMPSILGSLTTISVVTGGQGFNVGDLCNVKGTGNYGIAKVSSTTNQNGKVNFDIVYSGQGYTVNAIVSISGGGGTGANFTIGSLSDISALNLNNDYLLPMINSPLSNVGPFGDGLYVSNTTPLSSVLSYVTYEIGTIATLANINPGINYTSNLTITITEPAVLEAGISDGQGGYLGSDAVITATAGNANGLITSLQIKDSGFGYQPGELLTITTIAKTNISDATGYAVVLNQGQQQGYWVDDTGFTNSEKKLTDSYYYQPYSYEIQTELNSDIYSQIIKNILHPAGLAMFTKFILVDYQDTQVPMNQFKLTTTA